MAIALVNTDHDNSASNLTTYVFSVDATGPYDAVIIGTGVRGAGGGPTVTALTVDSAAWTKGVERVVGFQASCAGAVILSGSAGPVSITVQFNQGCSNARIDVAFVTGMDDATATHTSNDNADPISLAPNTLAGGFVMATSFGAGSAGQTAAWSGVTNEILDEVLETNFYGSSAYYLPVSDEAGHAIVCDWASADVNIAGVAAAYGPGALDFLLDADTGTYTLAGMDAVFLSGKGMLGAAGAYTLTGVAASLNSVRTLLAAAGSYALTGVAALKKITKVAAAGTYALTGWDVTFFAGKVLHADVAPFLLSGQAALKKITKVAAAGAYVLTGQATQQAISMAASAGSYVLTGLAAVVARAIRDAKYLRSRVSYPSLKNIRVSGVMLKNIRVFQRQLRGNANDPTLKE